MLNSVSQPGFLEYTLDFHYSQNLFVLQGVCVFIHA
jgi:hypothetical protein